MNLAAFRALLLPAGQAALQAAQALEPREADFLGNFTALSKQFPPGLARAALETALLRRKATAKFSHAMHMYFTRDALEQASGQKVSEYRVGRYRSYPLILDLGCSIGGDTLSLAGVGEVIGIDRDGLRLEMARENMRIAEYLGPQPIHPARFLLADLTFPLPLYPNISPSTAALFFDPARRANQRRAFSVHAYLPPLSIVRQWLPRWPALGVKISPGVDLAELAGYDAEIEFISLRGELKEAVLWFGPLRSAQRRATLLPGPHTLVADGGDPDIPVQEPGAFIYEPDPAVLRAGLVKTLAERLEAAQLDPEIAYLTAEKQTPTPFGRVWAVEDWFPFNLKRLRAYLRERGVGRVTVKKRGSPITPEQLIHDLRLVGDLERVVFLTQVRRKLAAIIALPAKPSGADTPIP